MKFSKERWGGGGWWWWKCHPAIVKDQDRMERRHQSAERQKLGRSSVRPPKGRNLKLRVWERLEFCSVERWYRYSGGSFHLRQNKHRVWFKFQRQLPSTVGVDRKTNIGLVGMKLKT